MEFPWYVVKGDISLDNFNNLCTTERGFVWRGYTHDYEMKPSAANYDKYGKWKSKYREEDCHPFEEIKRVAEKIFELNKLQKFPFEIPLSIRNSLFPGFYKIKDKIFEKLEDGFFPDYSLAQAMSIVQHECGGTSLLDFSTNKYKALYFAIGEKKNMKNDSWIFGLNVPYFETHKENLSENISGMNGANFDILYPSYFMNSKIAHQEGVFLYQKFKIKDSDGLAGGEKYQNIIAYFEAHLKKCKELNPLPFMEITVDEFLKMTEREDNKPIFYVLLRVPREEKPKLKLFLNKIGITDHFMMNDISTPPPGTTAAKKYIPPLRT